VAYSAGTAYLEVIPSFLNVESLIAKFSRDMAKSLDKSLGGQLGQAMKKAAGDASRDTDKAGAGLGKTFIDSAIKRINSGLAHIPATDRILKPLREELTAISEIDLGKGFDEKGFIDRVEKAYGALRKAQQDAMGKNAVSRFTNAGNAAQELGAVKDIVDAARKRGFVAGDAFSDAYLSRLKAMDRAVPDLRTTAASSQEERAVAALKGRIAEAMKLQIGQVATRDNNPLNLKIGAKINGDDLKREMEQIEALLDQFSERFKQIELVLPLDKARQQASGFFDDIKTQEERANEQAAAQYLKTWDAAIAEHAKREKQARDQATTDEQKRLDELERYHEQYLANLSRLEEQNRAQRLRAQRAELDQRARELRRAREQELAEEKRAEAELARQREKAYREDLRQRERAAAELEAAQKRAFQQTTAGEAADRLGRAADRIVDLPVHLQANDIDKELARIRDRIKSLGNLQIGVDLDADSFADEVKREFDKLSKIAHNQRIDIEVRTDAARAATELGGVLVLLNRIDGDKAEVKVDTDSATAGMKNLFAELSLNLSRLGSLIALGASLGTAIVPAAAAAASTIGAIGTAALAAGSGIGVMALAFSGIGDAVKALGNYADNQAKSNTSLARSANQVESANQQIKNAQAAIKAQRAITDALQDQRDAVQDVARANRDALARVSDAEDNLTEATLNEKDARNKLNEAYIEARRALRDLALQVRGNALDQRQAVLDVAKAKEELDKILANPRATQAEREQADITYQQRLLQLDDLKHKGAELADDQSKQFREGIGQSKQVKAARDDIANAEKRRLDAQKALTRAQADLVKVQLDGSRKLRDAEQKVADARSAAAERQRDAAYAEYQANQSLISARRALENATNRDLIAGGSQLDQLQQAMDKLSPTAQKFARYIFGLRDAFYKLRGAADPVLAGLQSAMEQLIGKNSKDAQKNLAPLFDFVNRVATKLGELFGRFADTLQGPTFTRFFDYISKSAVPTLDLLYQSFENLLVGVVNLFLAFTPLSDDVSHGFLDMTKRFRDWSEGLQKNKGFQDFINYLRDSGPQVAHLLGQIIKAIAGLVEAAAPIGSVVIDLFTKLFEQINKIPEKTLITLVAGIAAAAGALAVFAFATTIAGLSIAGLISGAIAILVVAFSVLAGSSSRTGQIIRDVWEKIKEAGIVAFEFLKQAIVALKPVFDNMVEAAMSFWRDGLVPVFDAIKALFVSLVDALRPSFGNIISILKTLGGWFFFLYDQVIVPAFKGIMAVSRVLFETLKPVFEAIGTVIGALATIIFWLLDKVVLPVIGGIVFVLVKTLGPVFQFLWKFILKPILQALGIAFQVVAAIIKVAVGLILIILKGLGLAFKWLYEKAIKPAWDALVKYVFKPMGEWLGKYVKPLWDKAINAIAKKWDGLKKALGAVAKIIIHYVLNEGILKGYNWLADKFNISPKNVKIDEPNGDWYTKSAIGGFSPGFASGGAVHGPGTATSDSIMARLSAGEHVLTAKEVAAAGGHEAIYALREALRQGWRLPGYAKGGEVSNDGKSQKLGFGGWLEKTAKKIGNGALKVFGSVADFLKDPSGSLKKMFEGLVKKIPSSAATGISALIEPPRKILGGLVDKVKDLVGLGGDGTFTGTLGKHIGVGGWPWQENVLKAAFGDRVTFTSTTGGQHAKNSWHYKGHAVDSIGPNMMAIFNWIKQNYGATSKELIYSPAVTGIKNGQPVNIRSFYGDSVYRGHFNHVHWAYDNGGLIPDTRNMPGGTMQVFHGSRIPDKVLTDTQWRNMATLAKQAQMTMAGGDTLNFAFRDSTLDESKLLAIQARRDALNRVNRVNY
jgi:hypothetical protein